MGGYTHPLSEHLESPRYVSLGFSSSWHLLMIFLPICTELTLFCLQMTPLSLWLFLLLPTFQLSVTCPDCCLWVVLSKCLFTPAATFLHQLWQFSLMAIKLTKCRVLGVTITDTLRVPTLIRYAARHPVAYAQTSIPAMCCPLDPCSTALTGREHRSKGQHMASGREEHWKQSRFIVNPHNEPWLWAPHLSSMEPHSQQ